MGNLPRGKARVNDRRALTTVGASYLGWLLDGRLAGPLGLIMIGLGGTFVPLLLTSLRANCIERREARAIAWVGSTALLVAIQIVASNKAVPRYAFPPLLLGIVVCAAALVAFVRWLAASVGWLRVKSLPNGLVAVVILAAGVLSASDALAEARDRAAQNRWIIDAAQLIKEDSRGRCTVVSGWPLRPALYWYTMCPAPPGGSSGQTDGRIAYVVLHMGEPASRQLPPALVASYRAASPEPIAVYTLPGGATTGEVLRLTPAPGARTN